MGSSNGKDAKQTAHKLARDLRRQELSASRPKKRVNKDPGADTRVKAAVRWLTRYCLSQPELVDWLQRKYPISRVTAYADAKKAMDMSRLAYTQLLSTSPLWAFDGIIRMISLAEASSNQAYDRAETSKDFSMAASAAERTAKCFQMIADEYRRSRPELMLSDEQMADEIVAALEVSGDKLTLEQRVRVQNALKEQSLH